VAVGWGIIGAGKLADIAIAPAIVHHDDSHLVAVCGRDIGRAEEFAGRHGGERAYDDYAQFLTDPGVDVVYIATPNNLHRSQVVAAVEAGKHVLVEKPMALSVDDGRAMVKAAAAAGRLLGVGLHLRHKATNREARRIVADGKLGRVFFAELSVGAGKGVYPYDTWRADPSMAGGGTLLHQGTHAIDLLEFLTGRRVVEVGCLVDGDPEDVFVASCRLDDGALASVSSHQLHAGTRPDWVVMGEGGWLQCRGGTSPAAGDELLLHRGTEGTAVASTDVFAYDAEVAAFAAAVRGGPPFDASGVDGLRNIAVFNALYRSARERKAVEVPPLD
jgi:1,5-anhydro-D-fructose reductase (1,5-anhydro-D-mannitol-forming)